MTSDTRRSTSVRRVSASSLIAAACAAALAVACGGGDGPTGGTPPGNANANGNRNANANANANGNANSNANANANTNSNGFVGGGNLSYLTAYESGAQPAAGFTAATWTDLATLSFGVAAPGGTGDAIEVAFGAANAWGAFGLAHRLDWNSIDWLFLNQFRTVELDVRFAPDATGVEDLAFLLEDAGRSDGPKLVSLIPGWAGMSAAQRYGPWHHVVVDLAALHPTVSRFEQFLLWNGGSGQPHLWLAHVRLGWVADTTAPRVTLNAATVSPTYDALTLDFTTDEPTVYRVDYGPTASYGQTAAGGTTADDYQTQRTVTLSGLSPGTTVYYRVVAGDHPYPSSATPNQGTYEGSAALPPRPTTPPTVSGLAAGQVRAVSATLAWTTDRPCTAVVTYQKSGGAAMVRPVTALATAGSLVLDLLEPSTTYAVSVVATDAFGNASAPATTTFVTAAAGAPDVTVAVDATATRPISPWIYGMNFYGEGDPGHLTLDRAGGNRWTAYNWENNASNAGSDWNYSSDAYLGGGSVPGEAVRMLMAADQQRGMASLITLQLQGWVAADEDGSVSITGTLPQPGRFKQVVFKKGSAFTAAPSASDAYVYMDEFLWALRGKFAADPFAAGAATPTFVSLDNEPELWNSTHYEIQGGTQEDAETYIQRTIALARALKDVAPGIVLFGPVHYGFNGIVDFQGGAGFSASYWFTDKYLQELKAASDAYGRRLVDVYDLHWYSEAQGEGTRITGLLGADLTDGQVQAIVQSPRSLWDPTYTESSWVADNLGGPVQLLPRLQAKIDASWPGTKLAITEYENGGDHHVAGAIAQADDLGIFGSQGVFAATYWPASDAPFVRGGFRAFRDYDGAGACFGDVSLRATSSDVGAVSAHVSTDAAGAGRVVAVLINRSTASQVVELTGLPVTGTARVWRITAASGAAQLAASAPVAPVLVGQVPVPGSSWQIALPALSVSTVEIR